MRSSLQHDAAWAAAVAALQLVAPALLPDEQKDALARFYEIVKAAIETYDIMIRREQLRQVPSRN
jgi:hypothetical protein